MSQQATDERNAFRLQKVAFSDLPGWQEDDPRQLLPALASVARHLERGKPYKTGSLGLGIADLEPLLSAVPASIKDAIQARRFFEEHCVPFRILPAGSASGFVTGFYEPEIDVRLRPDEEWRYPFYRRPADLVDLDDLNRPGNIDPSVMFGRETRDGIKPYPDRRDIDSGYLDGKGLEIAWARSKVDVFFAHVQGAARLRCPDGTVLRITYAAKAGHPFSAIGRLLIDLGEIDIATVSMQSIRAWLAANPERVDEILWHNRSYIFFREAPVGDVEAGPVAAAKVPLVAGRSLAVDRLIHTFGFPFFVSTPDLVHLDAGKPFARLMLALDTGSAIIGPARGDIFTGSGHAAGEQAGTIRNRADFYILVPRAAAARYAP